MKTKSSDHTIQLKIRQKELFSMDHSQILAEINNHLNRYESAKARNDLNAQYTEISQVVSILRYAINNSAGERQQSYSSMIRRPLEKQMQLQTQLKQTHNRFVCQPQGGAVREGLSAYPGPPVCSSACVAQEPCFPVNTPSPQTVDDAQSHQSYIDRPLSSHERRILSQTSVINGNAFLPWFDSDEHDFNNTPFTDSFDYHVTQSKFFAHSSFVQPTQLYADPVLIKWPLDPFAVCQHQVGDCTIVSSMISCANYEKRFKKPLISGILFPHRSGRPAFNPAGKYIVKLTFNGIPRKVVVDHRILVKENQKPVTVSSRNLGELWPVIIEKAFLKVHGGYCFDGGNGGQDTYSLTGWLPEIIYFDNPDTLWKRLYGAFNTGDCLLTSGTRSDLGTDCEERLGLASSHCYCVTQLVEIEGHRLLQLRNPWGRLSWKGRFSYQDTSSWSSAMQSKLCPDFQRRLQNPSFDDGLFWMSYEDFQRCFKNFNVNWSPELLNTSVTYHDFYTNIFSGYTKDTRNLSSCPQFVLDLTNTARHENPIYIMLSRHYVNYDDMLGNDRTYLLISLQVYRTEGPQYLVKDRDAAEVITKDVAFTNAPYVLCRFTLPPGHFTYNVVVMSHKEEPRNLKTFNFSIQVRFHNDVRGSVTPISDFPKYHFLTRVAGEWGADNNGGRPSEPTYALNPMYHFRLDRPTFLNARMETIGNVDTAVYLRLLSEESLTEKRLCVASVIADSDGFTRGACVLEKELAPGAYVLVASQYTKKNAVRYTLSVRSSHPLIVSETQTHSIPLPELGAELRLNYTFLSMLYEKTTGLSVFGIRGFLMAEKYRMLVEKVSLVTVKMTVSVGSVPVVAIFPAPHGQLPASMMLKDAISTSPRNEDGASTFMSVQVNPGYYFIACGLKNSGNADAQVIVFCNYPLRFCSCVCWKGDCVRSSSYTQEAIAILNKKHGRNRELEEIGWRESSRSTSEEATHGDTEGRRWTRHADSTDRIASSEDSVPKDLQRAAGRNASVVHSNRNTNCRERRTTGRSRRSGGSPGSGQSVSTETHSVSREDT